MAWWFVEKRTDHNTHFLMYDISKTINIPHVDEMEPRMEHSLGVWLRQILMKGSHSLPCLVLLCQREVKKMNEITFSISASLMVTVI